SGGDVAASELAVEADVHDAAGTQYRSKNAPACHRVLEMVQHADALDKIEGPADGAQSENVGLCVFDVRNASLSRFSLRVGEARSTEIHRQNFRRWKSLRRLYRLLSGAATGDEHVDLAVLSREGGSLETELALEEGTERGGAIDRRRPDPSRIRMILVLAGDPSGRVIVDRGQLLQRGAVFVLLNGLFHLLREQAG